MPSTSLGLSFVLIFCIPGFYCRFLFFVWAAKLKRYACYAIQKIGALAVKNVKETSLANLSAALMLIFGASYLCPSIP